jgi:hypothetical protein
MLAFRGSPHRSLRTIQIPARVSSQHCINPAVLSLLRGELFGLLGHGVRSLPQPQRDFRISSDGRFDRSSISSVPQHFTRFTATSN